MKRAPSLTWFFIAIAAVLVAGFAWLEFHQHGQAVPAEAIASSWQPPKARKPASFSVTPKPSAPKSKKVSMATGSRKAPAKRSIAEELPPPEPERNYDDMPAPTDRDDPVEPAPEQVEEGTFQEVDSEDIEAEKAVPLKMKGFGGEPMKLPENLQKEFEDLSEEHGDDQAKDSKDGTSTDKNSADKKAGTDQEPGSAEASERLPASHRQDAGDGTETGDVDPSSQRPPEE